jgi:hypothetical protein
MAFTIDHTGRPRQRFLYVVRRHSDGLYLRAGRGWQPEPVYNVLPEQAPGRYSTWLVNARDGEIYEVTVARGQQGMPTIGNYRCDSRGRPAVMGGTPVKTTIVGGILHVDGRPEKAGVILQALSSNQSTIYTAIRWTPSNIASCNCPGWTNSVKNKGKGISERSCKHTKQVAGMTHSVTLDGSNLPPMSSPAAGHAGRAGRGIELD